MGFHQIELLFWQVAACLLLLSIVLYLFCLVCIGRAYKLAERSSQIAQARDEFSVIDMHDALIQDVQGLMLSLQALSSQLASEGKNYHLLEHVLNQADVLLAGGRQHVREYIAARLQAADLEHLFIVLGESLVKETGVAFHFLVCGQRLAIPAMRQDAIYLLGKLGLQRAFFHAAASKVEMELDYGFAQLSLLIRDHGDGLAHAASHEMKHASERYLWEMQLAVEAQGGNMKVYTHPRLGTEISLQFKRICDTRAVGADTRAGSKLSKLLKHHLHLS